MGVTNTVVINMSREHLKALCIVGYDQSKKLYKLVHTLQLQMNILSLYQNAFKYCS